MEAGLLILVVLFLGLGFVAVSLWWLIMLIEAVRIPDAQWDAARQNKLLQVLLMVVLGVIGTIIYQFTARPELKRVGPPPQAYPQNPYAG